MLAVLLLCCLSLMAKACTILEQSDDSYYLQGAIATQERALQLSLAWRQMALLQHTLQQSLTEDLL